jgi:uncharacterized protein HemX
VAELTEQQESPVGDNKHPPRSRGGFWFGATVLLLVTGIAGAGFFLFSQLRAKQEGLSGEVKNEMSKQLGGYQTQLGAIQSQLAAMQTDLTNKDTQLNKTMSDFSHSHDEKLENTRKELSESIVRLQRQLGKTRGDWLIADAEYLLSVANERLYLIGDVNTTRQALEAADQRLRESGDASAFKIRDQVIKDIAALANIKPIDVVGLYSAIQSLEERINNLTLLLPYAGKAPEKTETPAATLEQGSEGSLLDTAKHKFSEIVTIKHTDQSIKEILTPEQAQFIRDQLRVKLEVVKVALVQQNEALYHAGLADAKKWVEQQFTQNNDTKAFVTELNRFGAIKLRSHFPDISLSLKMLKDITKLRSETDKALDFGTDDAAKPVDSAKPADNVELAPVTGSTQSMPTEAEPGIPAAQPNSDSTEPKSNSGIMPPPQPAGTEPMQTPQSDAGAIPSSQSPVSETDQSGQPASGVGHEAPEHADVAPSDDGQQAADTGEVQHEAPKQAPSLVTKLLEKIKQYLPGKH